MAVSLVGSVGHAFSATSPVTGAYGQTTTSGNLLVAVIGWASTTLETFTPTASGSWARLIPAAVGNNSAGTSRCGADMWWLHAAGGDAAPVFTQTSGTGGMTCVIFELAGANTTTPYDTSGLYQSGTTGITPPTMTPVTTGNVTAAGEWGISAFTQEDQAASTQTWTELGTGWTNAYNDSATSQVPHLVCNYQAGPSSGATLSDSGHFSAGTNDFAAAVVAAVAAASSGTTVNPAAAAATGTSLGEDDSAATGTVGINMTIQGM